MRLAAAIVALALGAGLLNYTKAWSHDGHVAWASEAGAPAPAPWMFWAGLLVTVLAGWLLGSRRRPS